MSKIQNDMKFNAASKTYGRALWEKVMDIVSGTCNNTPAKAVVLDTDAIRKLKPGLYYGKVSAEYGGGLQLVFKYPEVDGQGGWCFAGLLRDKTGEPIMSDDHTYDLREVKCRQDFKVPNVKNDDGSDVTINAGYLTVKAYAAV